MTERLVALASTVLCAVLVASGLAGCSSTSSYCSTLKSDHKQLTQLSTQSAASGTGGAKALHATLTLLSDLRGRAPDDISPDWTTLVDAVRGLDQAVAASGVSPGDFAGGKRPAGVTTGQYQAVQQAATELQSTPVQQASQSIEQHAQEVCKVDLGSGLGGSG